MKQEHCFDLDCPELLLEENKEYPGFVWLGFLKQKGRVQTVGRIRLPAAALAAVAAYIPTALAELKKTGKQISLPTCLPCCPLRKDGSCSS